MILDLDKPTTDLEAFEIRVLDYLKVAALGNKKGDPSHLEFKELKEYSQKKASAFQASWGPEVRKWVEAQMGGTLITDESRKANRKWGLRNILALVGFGILAFVVLDLARVAFIVAAVLCLILAVIGAQTLPAWRNEVAREVYGWQGFKRTLRDYTRMKDAPNDFFELWDRYFVYAAAFGVAALFLKNIRKAAPLAGVAEDELIRRGSWMGSSQSFADFGSFSQSITSMSSALNSASASASSGGSSSGGGGGGGGGSSGGR
jgi:uncharacterized membrane protein